MIFVLLPAPEQGSDQPGKARSVDIEILLKRIKKKLLFPTILNMLMPEVEAILPMRICRGKFRFRQKIALLFMLFLKRRSRIRAVKHELMKISIVTDGISNDVRDVFRTVVFQTDNG